MEAELKASAVKTDTLSQEAQDHIRHMILCDSEITLEQIRSAMEDGSYLADAGIEDEALAEEIHGWASAN